MDSPILLSSSMYHNLEIQRMKCTLYHPVVDFTCLSTEIWLMPLQGCQDKMPRSVKIGHISVCFTSEAP